MEETKNIYKEVYVVFDLIERLYVMTMYKYDVNDYTKFAKWFENTIHIKLAKQFKTELDASNLAKEAKLNCFRVDKIYVLEY